MYKVNTDVVYMADQLIPGCRYVRVKGSGAVWKSLGNMKAKCMVAGDKSYPHIVGQIITLAATTVWYSVDDPFVVFVQETLNGGIQSGESR